MTTKIDKLTPEQEALIPAYREKWKAIALSTERIDRQKATEAVGFLYTEFLEKYVPLIKFHQSPYAAIREILRGSSHEKLGRNYSGYVVECAGKQLGNFWSQKSFLVRSRIARANLHSCPSELGFDFSEQSFRSLDLILQSNQAELVYQSWIHKVEIKAISSFDWAGTAAAFDFFTSELDCHYEPVLYQAVEQLVISGGMFFLFEQLCLVCDRPTKISFDSKNRLHAEGETAIQFADGFSVYAHHGKLIQVGEQWQLKLPI